MVAFHDIAQLNNSLFYCVLPFPFQTLPSNNLRLIAICCTDSHSLMIV